MTTVTRDIEDIDDISVDFSSSSSLKIVDFSPTKNKVWKEKKGGDMFRTSEFVSNIDKFRTNDGWSSCPLLSSVVDVIIPALTDKKKTKMNEIVPSPTTMTVGLNEERCITVTHSPFSYDDDEETTSTFAFDAHYKEELMKKKGFFFNSPGSLYWDQYFNSSFQIQTTSKILSSSFIWKSKHCLNKMKYSLFDSNPPHLSTPLLSTSLSSSSSSGTGTSENNNIVSGKNDDENDEDEKESDETNDDGKNGHDKGKDDGKSGDSNNQGNKNGDEENGNNEEKSDKVEIVKPKLEFTMIVDDFHGKANTAATTPQVSELFGDDTTGHWRLLVYPRSHRGGEQWCSAYLAAAVDVDNLGHGWWKKVDFSITAIHPNDPKFNIYNNHNTEPCEPSDVPPEPIELEPVVPPPPLIIDAEGGGGIVTVTGKLVAGEAVDEPVTVVEAVEVTDISSNIDDVKEDKDKAASTLKGASDLSTNETNKKGKSSVDNVSDEKKDKNKKSNTNSSNKDDSKEKDLSITRKGTNTFKGKGATLAHNFEWGYNDLVKVETLSNKGFLSMKGKLAFKVELTILETKEGISYSQLSKQELQDDLIWAVGVAAVPMVKQCLLSNADPTHVYRIKKKTETPLHKASCTPGWRPGALEVVSLLIDSGINVNEVNSLDETPLLLAADVSGCFEICHLLLLKGADPTIRTDNGWSPFNCAAKRGRNEIIDLLISFNCPIEEPIPEYSGLLHAAAQGHVDTIKLLLKYGIEVNVCDKHGDTALWKLVDKDLADVALLMSQEYHASIARCSRDRKKVTKARLILKHAEKKKEKLKEEKEIEIEKANKLKNMSNSNSNSSSTSDADNEVFNLIMKSENLMKQLVAEEDEAIKSDEKKKLKKKNKRDRAKNNKKMNATSVMCDVDNNSNDNIDKVQQDEVVVVKKSSKVNDKNTSKKVKNNNMISSLDKASNMKIQNKTLKLETPSSSSSSQLSNDSKPLEEKVNDKLSNHSMVDNDDSFKTVVRSKSKQQASTTPKYTVKPATVITPAVITPAVITPAIVTPAIVTPTPPHVPAPPRSSPVKNRSTLKGAEDETGMWLESEWGDLEKDILSLTAFEDSFDE